jgi:small subunit ribosomal protein S7
MSGIFGKWDPEEVVIKDLGLANYINLETKEVPHTFGVTANKKFGSIKVNIVERFINKLMRSGQGKKKLGGKIIRGRKSTGMKLMIMGNVEEAFEIIHAKTKQNPIQVLVAAVEKSAPNEDVTRLRKGGISFTESVDVAPTVKLSESLKNLSLAIFASTFGSKKPFAQAIADELILASEGDNKGYAIKRKDEIERIAKSSR